MLVSGFRELSGKSDSESTEKPRAELLNDNVAVHARVHEAVVVKGASGGEDASEDAGESDLDVGWSASFRVERYVVALAVLRRGDGEPHRVARGDLHEVGAEHGAQCEDVVGLVGAGGRRRRTVGTAARGGEEKNGQSDTDSH